MQTFLIMPADRAKLAAKIAAQFVCSEHFCKDAQAKNPAQYQEVVETALRLIGEAEKQVLAASQKPRVI